MPDSRRLRRDRERAPLDAVLTWLRMPHPQRNGYGEWDAGNAEQSRIWARREDPDTTQDRILDPEGMRVDGERVYVVRYDARISVEDSVIDAAGMHCQIVEIEPIARRRWLRLRCIEVERPAAVGVH